MKDDVVIVSATRTPVGSFNGALSPLKAHDLGAIAIKSALEKAGVPADAVSEVILGQVLIAGQGQNPVRQASIKAGVPIGSPAWGVSMVCGSGLRAVTLAAQAIANGDSDIVVAGGQESMSQSEHAAHLRNGQRMGNLNFVDTMIKDGLWDAFNGYHMGTTAENVATKYQITRQEQDAFAVGSQNKAEAAQKAGRFKDEITPVTISTRKGDVVVDQDEYIRHGATLDAMAKLKPAFSKDGTVTAGNASGVNDGAAAMIIASAEAVKKYGLTPRARVLGLASAGVPPRIMGIGPIPAVKKLMERLNLKISAFDVVELNEAFASQGIAVLRGLGIAEDADHVNPNGGAIALGHPLGMSGARIAATAVHQLEKTGGRYGLATMCVGVGQGVALAVERVN